MLGLWKRYAAKQGERKKNASEYQVRLARAEKRILLLERRLALLQEVQGQKSEQETEGLTTAQLVDEWVNGKARAE